MKSFTVYFAIALLFALPRYSLAQQIPEKYNPSDFKDKPIWIDMMNDPEANYFETIKAFREYWTGYHVPGEPEEMETKGNFKREVGLKDRNNPDAPQPVKIKDTGNLGDLSFEVKQFKGWLRNVQPWVQDDGRIMPEAERQQIIDRQQEELRTIEKNQKN